MWRDYGAIPRIGGAIVARLSTSVARFGMGVARFGIKVARLPSRWRIAAPLHAFACVDKAVYCVA
jgi:hypothetical protein